MTQSMIDRLLRIMKLLTDNTMYSIEDIAPRLNISARTVYRYINGFRDAGFVIKKYGNLVRLDKSSPYFKEISELIHFTEEEAYILKSAIESIDENNLLKQNLKKKLYTVYDYKILAETIVNKKDSNNVKLLVEAIQNNKQVLLKNYSSAHGETIRDRKVEPFAFTTNYVQVWCFDTEERVNKLFKTSRISSVELLCDSWQYNNIHKEGNIDIFRISSDEQYHIRLKLNLRAYSLLTEEYPVSSKYIENITTNEWILDTYVCSFEGVGRFILGLWEDIEIIESEELKDYLCERVEKMVATIKFKCLR